MKEGETRKWLRLASHLHLARQECMQKHTSTELDLWMAYLDELEQRDKKEYFYFAQIAAEIRRTISEHPEKVELDPFLLKWKYEPINQENQPTKQVEASILPEEINLEDQDSYEDRQRKQSHELLMTLAAAMGGKVKGLENGSPYA